MRGPEVEDYDELLELAAVATVHLGLLRLNDGAGASVSSNAVVGTPAVAPVEVSGLPGGHHDVEACLVEPSTRYHEIYHAASLTAPSTDNSDGIFKIFYF